MKFGKELLRAAAASEAVVNPDWWLDYKVLKKMLKHNPMEEDLGNDPPRNEKERITNSEVERNFFLALQAELRKVESRFSALKVQALRNAEESLKHTSGDISVQEGLGLCTSAHLFLLIVENFGVLNYCGFKKILKKHDKLRGVTTRDSYMIRMVNNKSFSHSSEFRPLLEQLEAQYRHLALAVEGGSAAATSSSESTALFESQRKELEEISKEGNDRLKSLASVAVSMDENDRQLKRVKEDLASPSSSPEPYSTTTTTTTTTTAAAVEEEKGQSSPVGIAVVEKNVYV